jgi:hypothetical protein
VSRDSRYTDGFASYFDATPRDMQSVASCKYPLKACLNEQQNIVASCHATGDRTGSSLATRRDTKITACVNRPQCSEFLIRLMSFSLKTLVHNLPITAALTKSAS